jgi:O-acetylhomoserine/O-acetylserine sulfhydrylase-like pyridoxal-dependent enzyme
MRTTLCCTLLAALLGIWPTTAQQPPRAPTLEERIARLESGLATVETRFGLESSRPADLGIGQTGAALAGRVDALERSLERLASDVQRIERLADTAARDASQAQRDASMAQQLAREASLRAR